MRRGLGDTDNQASQSNAQKKAHECNLDIKIGLSVSRAGKQLFVVVVYLNTQSARLRIAVRDDRCAGTLARRTSTKSRQLSCNLSLIPDGVSLSYMMTVKYMLKPEIIKQKDGEPTVSVKLGWGASQGTR
jgi:hypothetical protein